MALSLSLLVLKTSQLDRLKAFYECIGCLFVKEKHGKGPVHYAAEMEGCLLELYPIPVGKDSEAPTIRVGFRVERLDEVITLFQEQALPIDQAPVASPWGYRAVVIDPDGRKVELVEAG